MIGITSKVRVWLAAGHTDMSKGMPGLARLVQEALGRDPHAGDLYIFRGRRGDLLKIIWHDGVRLYAKRLDRGRFVWPTTAGRPVALTAAQLGYMLEGIDWRNPQTTCWAHARQVFFKLADIASKAKEKNPKRPIVVSPMALEAVRRIDEIFAIARDLGPGARRATGPAQGEERAASGRSPGLDEGRAGQALGRNNVAKAMDYMLKRWAAFSRFLEEGRVCLTNNAAERAMRPPALGRKAWLFAGSDRGGERVAMMFSLIATAKLNDVDPQAWLADVLGRIAEHPANRLGELLPWNWNAQTRQAA